MDGEGNSLGVKNTYRRPPALSRTVTGLWLPVTIGTALWLVALVVMLVGGIDGIWRWTALTGAGLGFVGFGVITWQSAASRRGHRGAQRDL